MKLIILNYYNIRYVTTITVSSLLQIRDLEAEFEAEQRRGREAFATARKMERQYKELLALSEDDKRRIAELASLNDSLTIKIKTYKRQIDEAVCLQFIIYCEIIVIWWTCNYVFFVGRAIHKFKTPTKYLFTSVILRII